MENSTFPISDTENLVCEIVGDDVIYIVRHVSHADPDLLVDTVEDAVSFVHPGKGAAEKAEKAALLLGDVAEWLSNL